MITNETYIIYTIMVIGNDIANKCFEFHVKHLYCFEIIK